MLNFITTTEETDPLIENDFVVPTCFSTCVGCGIRSDACMNSIWHVQLPLPCNKGRINFRQDPERFVLSVLFFIGIEP